MQKRAAIIIEVLAVLFVAGLVAAVAIPDYDRDHPDNQHKAIILALEQVRTAIDRYWADNDAVYPQTEDLTDLQSPPKKSFAAKPRLGGYLKRIPDNPFTASNTVGSIDAPIGSTDWVYDPNTGIFKANDNEMHRAL
jgi:type II secretory pathway pseudopilin PulG